MTASRIRKPPNIVLVLCDSMRARNVSCYGHSRRTTPNIDRLASSGVRFANAFVPAPFTVASTASILTSTYPSVHRLEYYGQRLADGLCTLPEVLHAAGYYTAAFVANPHVNADAGLTRGFTDFTDGRPWYKQWPGMQHVSAWAESGKAINREVQRTLHRVRGRPFFLFVFYNDAHIPFSDLPRTLLPLVGQKFHSPDFETTSYTDSELARVVDLYDQSITRADHYVGQLHDFIQSSPYARDTLFIVSADHGEGLDRRFKRAGHGRLYDNGIHVPFVVSGHGVIDAGNVVDELVTSLDIAPTVCELAGIEGPVQFQGQSLVPYLRNEVKTHPRPHVISEYHDSRCIRTKTWKLIQRGAGIGHSVESNGDPELYDVAVDPLEEENVAQQHPDLVAELTRTLRAFVTDALDKTQHTSSFDVDDTVVERLRSLGYLK